MRPDARLLPLALLAGCLATGDGRPELEAARAGAPRGVHEVGELGDPRVPVGLALAPRLDEALLIARPWLVAPDPFLRLTALESLRRLAERAPALVRTRFPDLFDPALEDPDPALRWRAAWAIGRVGLRRPGLPALLRDPSWRVAERAAWALGRGGDPQALADLVGALEREEPVAAAAEGALEAITGARHGRDPAAWRAAGAAGGPRTPAEPGDRR